ncbi:MAG: hypothetical protein AAFZ07_22215 [Actinomycetota bacterium]
MTSHPTPDVADLDVSFDDVLAPELVLDDADRLDLDDAVVDPAVVRLADTELLGPDDTHLGIVDVELLPVDAHDDHLLLDTLDGTDAAVTELALPEHDPTEPLGLDLGFE